AAVRASRDPEETTTLHALAEEFSAHACAWDERDDPDGHAAAWDALHTLLTAAGAWVEHLAKMRPHLAPAEADDIVTAVRRLATHLTAVLPGHDAPVRADERQRMEAAGWRPPIRHGDPHMLAAVYGYELGQENASRREAEIRADERARVAGAIPGWAHEQEISGYADRWWLRCIWCNDSTKAMRDGDCLEDILTAARDHHRTCAHRLAARQHATTAEGDHHV